MIHTIHVVATSLDGTRAALAVAAPLAARQQARIVLLVHRPAGLESPPHATNRLVDRYDEISRDLGPPVQIRVCFSPNMADAAAQMTPPEGTVFVGGHTSIFWPSAEQRLAVRLRRSGRKVVFVGCDSGSHNTQGVTVDA